VPDAGLPNSCITGAGEFEELPPFDNERVREREENWQLPPACAPAPWTKMEPAAVAVMVALVLSSKGDAPLAKVEPLGRVTSMVVPELFVNMKVSPEMKDTDELEKVRL
jgi:hypothetical protein